MILMIVVDFLIACFRWPFGFWEQLWKYLVYIALLSAQQSWSNRSPPEYETFVQIKYKYKYKMQIILLV